MSEIAFACPRCGRGYQVEPQLGGKKARCKRCGEIFRVPAWPPATALVPEPLLPASAEDDGSAYDLADPLFDPLPPPRPAPAAGRIAAGPGSALPHPSRAGMPPPESRNEDAADFSPAWREWLANHGKFLGLAAGLVLLAVALWALLPRAWNAGQLLLGAAEEHPNEPVPSNAETDPDLEFPEFAPERAALIAQHRDALMGMAVAFGGMAQGYADMRNPSKFAAGQAAAARSSQDLDAAASKGAALPKLELGERAALVVFVDRGLRPALARALRELRQLKATPGINGDFSKLDAALQQTSVQIDREYRGNPSKPAVLVTLNNLTHESQQRVISDRATKLIDPGAGGEVGWRKEAGKTQIKVSPVLSTRAFAERIDFGKVTQVQGRRIEVEVTLSATGDSAPPPAAPAASPPASP
jgi:hypothetical protein